MKHNEYVKLLKFFDDILWENKITETGWNYVGLTLDYYFNNSVFNIDYLNIEDYFSSNGDYEYQGEELLKDQFENINEKRRLILIQNILNIFKRSSYDKDVSNLVMSKSIKFLERNNIKINNPSNGVLQLIEDNIIGAGSYCVIKKINDGVLKKELRTRYSKNEKLKKRMKYEYENMYKLRDCPQILNVYSYMEKEHSYLMEEADMNIYEYLNNEVDISFEEKIKIVYDLLNGMKYAHDNSIIHRDLHLGNILKLDKDFLICDFGLSKDESIERSLKSSATEKNNHIFLDPLAIGDFTKLDKKSDIYSVGKIIDYVFTFNSKRSKHIFTFIVEKCTSRNKDNRYNTIDEILNDVEFKLKERDNKFNKKVILEKIKNGILDVSVNEYIFSLVKSNIICDYLVKNNLNSFGKTILKFKQIDQIKILQAIKQEFAKSTGYGGFHNYDIFADITYFVCLNTDESNVFSVAHSILKVCARYRYSANDLLEEVDKNNL